MNELQDKTIKTQVNLCCYYGVQVTICNQDIKKPHTKPPLERACVPIRFIIRLLSPDVLGWQLRQMQDVQFKVLSGLAEGKPPF